MAEERNQAPVRPTSASDPSGLSETDTNALRRRAEHLLDEMLLGAVDVSASDPNLDDAGPVRTRGAGDQRTAALRAEVSTLLQGPLVRSRVLPTERLSPVGTAVPAPFAPSSAATAVAPARRAFARFHTSPPSVSDPEPTYPGPAETLLSDGRRSPSTSRQEHPQFEAARSPSSSQTPVDLASAEIPPGLLDAQALQEEIASLYEEVNQALVSRREVTGHALALLREARTIVLTQPERTGKARYNIRQVRTMLERARHSRRSDSVTGIRLFLYLALWLALCVVGVGLLYRARELLPGGTETDSALALHAIPFLLATVLGGVGGVLGAMVALVNHIRERRGFDRQYNIRFMIQPIMGVVLGSVVYLLFALAYSYFALDYSDNLVVAALPIAAALAAGLWQEMVYSLLYRSGSLFRRSSRRRV